RYRRGKAGILGDQPGCHEAPITAAGDPQPPWIGDPFTAQVIQSGQTIIRIGPAHVPEYLAGEFLASAGAAAGIGKEDRVATLEQHQYGQAAATQPRWTPVPYGPSMEIHHQRVRGRSLRPQQPTLNVQPVRCLPGDLRYHLD